MFGSISEKSGSYRGGVLLELGERHKVRSKPVFEPGVVDHGGEVGDRSRR
jgi:hypothetical protein